MNTERRIMRDVFIEHIYNRMFDDSAIFFVTADFGSPKLDKLREDFNDRFINVGIAEQNLINVSSGLALEGFTVYAYAIAPFFMRAYEQIRNNLSLLSHTHKINVNFIGVGAGLSYDVSGPTHHAFEDITIMRTLPNISIFSPSDCVLVSKFLDFSIAQKSPKYLRFDGKPLPNIYTEEEKIDFNNGFHELVEGDEVCLVSTGNMTHNALSAVDKLKNQGINVGLIDVFIIKPLDEDLLFEGIKKYKYVITLEEAFIKKGGLDSLISCILSERDSNIKFKRMGFDDAYVFNYETRDYMHRLTNLADENIIHRIKDVLKKDS